VISCRQISDGNYVQLPIQDPAVHFSGSTVIGTRLTRYILGDYNERNFFYPNDSAASREEKTIEELLAWLYYPGMHQRHEEVERAHKNTFQWIFDDGPAEEGTGYRPKDTGFITWLRDETGVFWIYGKPGAGKSTLMKCIMDDPRLNEHAGFWAGSSKLSICSFYFWKLGSKLQKSLCGFYRALLWQILKDDPVLTRNAFPGWHISFCTTEPQLNALKAALNRVVRESVLRRRYLMVVDGLDEYENGEASQEKLCEDLSQMAESGSVKVIVASRPERAFESHFSHGRSLAVHELTGRDIELFARDRLIDDRTIRPSRERISSQELPRLEAIVRQIAIDSQGVFLWTRIVVNLARIHIRDHHDFDMLEASIFMLPPDLEGLFDHIMNRISNLEVPEKVKGLRYLAITAHWYATNGMRDSRPPLFVLGIGCELSSQTVTGDWLEKNAHRLSEIGSNEPRIEGQIESYCFGLLQTSVEPGVTRKRVGYLHRTLKEYLSRHTAMQRVQDLSLPDHEPFDASTAILLGLVAVNDLVSTVCASQLLFFNKLAEKSTGVVQLALLLAFDHNAKADFTALVKRNCRFDHDHEPRCASSPEYEHWSNDGTGFEGLTLNFALNRRHPLIPNTRLPFLDMYAITIDTDANALLRYYTNDHASGGDPPRVTMSAEQATHLLKYALNKRSFQSLNKNTRFGNNYPDPNVEALQRLLQLGACPEMRIDSASAWERFIDDMIFENMKHAEAMPEVGDETAESSGHVYDPSHAVRCLEALYILISHGVRQDVCRTCAVMYEDQGPPAPTGEPWRPPSHKTRSHDPSQRIIIEFRRYSLIHLVRQISKLLQRKKGISPRPHASEIAKLEQMRLRLEEQNANISPKCSWSDLQEGRETFKERHDWEGTRDWETVSEALMNACQTGCDIAKYQRLQVGTLLQRNERIVTTWLPHGSRAMLELPERLVPSIRQYRYPPLRFNSLEHEEFGVVGWLVYETNPFECLPRYM
jgi:hypothetical protein